MILAVSSTKSAEIQYEVVIHIIDNNIQLDNTSYGDIAPMSPYVWRYESNLNGNSSDNQILVVSINSDHKDSCAVVAIQPLDHPFRYREDNIIYHSRWQTVLSQGSIDVRMNDPKFRSGFFIIAMSTTDSAFDHGCDKKLLNSKDSFKTMEITVSIQEQHLLKGTIELILIYVIPIVVICIIYACLSPMSTDDLAKLKEKFGSNSSLGDDNDGYEDIDKSKEIDEGTEVPESDATERVKEVLDDITEQAMKISDENPTASMSHVLETLYVWDIEKREEERDERVQNHELTLKDMTLTLPDNYYEKPDKSLQYLWLLICIGMFYSMPIIQMVYEEHKESLHDGNLNTCQYNYKCKSPTSQLEDYGSIISNISYVFAGLFLVAIVYIRQRKYVIRKQTLGKLGKNRGIPEQFGILYALGLATIGSGILSACYHLCPTHLNFQFDTTFIYILSVLIILKCQEYRNPDTPVTARNAYILMGIIVLAEVCGYYTTNIVFWAIFGVLYFILAMFFVLTFYFNGLFGVLWVNWYEILTNLAHCQLSPNLKKNKWRLFMAIFIFLVNMLMLSFFMVDREPGVSRYILAIIIINMGLQLLYYISMKWMWNWKDAKPGEKVFGYTYLFLVLAVFFVVVACYFFINEVKSTFKSPAESRELNKPCVVWIFDNHDLWHVFGANGIFFLALVMLTLEDGNVNSKWEDIPVF